MKASLLGRVLLERRRLRQRESWTPQQVLAPQRTSVRRLRDLAVAESPFYRELHRNLGRAPLEELPVVTKSMLMQHFDDILTEHTLGLADIRSFRDRMTTGQLLSGRWYVSATAGTTGEPGLFVWGPREWAGILASYSRPYAWGGADIRLTRRTRMAVISSTTPWHQSALVGATVDSPFLPTLRLDSGAPLEAAVAQLAAFGPEVLVGYASMLGLLAAEALAGRLRIAPTAVFSASEVLTGRNRRLIRDAWGIDPCDVYAATETAGIAAECEQHDGLHVFEDLLVVEVVDANHRPVEPGTFGAKTLVTVLGSRTLPLIRYEMSDSIRWSAPARPCACGRPFAMIDAIQGREEESLPMRGRKGERIVVQPVVVHQVMDTVPATGWQLVQDDAGLTLLVVGLDPTHDTESLGRRLQQSLSRIGVDPPTVHVRRVESIPRTALGKASLIRAARGPLEGGRGHPNS